MISNMFLIDWYILFLLLQDLFIFILHIIKILRIGNPFLIPYSISIWSSRFVASKYFQHNLILFVLYIFLLLYLLLYLLLFYFIIIFC